MARGFYQNTIALAQPDGTLKSLAGVNIFVYQPGTQTLATIYAGRTGAAQANNPLLTDSTGLVEFYADVGEYDIRTKDTNAVPRIADRTVGWNSFNGSNQGVPSALLARDNGLDLSAIAADVTRQMLPIGAVIDWWRPDGTVPIPAGFEICDGHTVSAGSHDFPNWSAQRPPTTVTVRRPSTRRTRTLRASGESAARTRSRASRTRISSPTRTRRLRSRPVRRQSIAALPMRTLEAASSSTDTIAPPLSSGAAPTRRTRWPIRSPAWAEAHRAERVPRTISTTTSRLP
jgi:hypothetical protein